MTPLTIIFILFALTTALSLAAVRVRVPYPTAMVIAGLLIGTAVCLFPSLQSLSLQLDPEVLFVAILPPLLYGAAWNTSWNGFRANLRPILLLSIGCVIFTTLGIAAIAMALIPGFTWPAAFALGAIVSPPDAIAATAVTERLRVPKRIVTILEGESLVNDASALVVYRFAVAAAMGSLFSLGGAVGSFFLVAGGGIGIGLLLAFLLHQLHERIEQPLIETALTLLTPYAAYLTAESIHTSGVLAVVACGLVLSRHSSHLFSPQTRLTAVAFWNFLIFMLNGAVFILIGLQLPTILHALTASTGNALLYAAIVCAALILLRMLWVFPGAYLPRIFPAIRKREPRPAPGQVFLLGWVGMRGVVSLAAALALPEKLPDGHPFPARNLILFLTFAVILVTLVLQSLTLAAVIRALKIESPECDWCEEAQARRHAITAALESLDQPGDAPPDGRQSHAFSMLRSMYAHRLEHLEGCDNSDDDTPDPENALFRQTIRAQRARLIELRDHGQISEELHRKLERELDLEESRLPV